MTYRLLTDVETPNDVEVTLRIHLLEIVQQAPPATHQHQQASPRGEVLLVRPKVLSQPVDPGRQNRDLDFRRARVLVTPPKLPNQIGLPLLRNGHLLPRRLHLGWLDMPLTRQDPPTVSTRTLPTLTFTNSLQTTVYHLGLRTQPRKGHWRRIMANLRSIYLGRVGY